MYNFNSHRKRADNRIRYFGGDGVITIKGLSGGYDSNGDAQADTPDTEVEGTISILVKYKTSEVNGESILTGDSYVLWQSETALNDNDEMTVTLNGKTLRVIDFNPVSSIDDVNLYIKLQLRK